MSQAGIMPLTMPKWGMSMVAGTVVTWLKNEGDVVNAGEPLFEVETEKIVNACEATGAGVLRRQLVGAGDTLPVGALLGVVTAPEVTDAVIDDYIAGFEVSTASVDAAAGKAPQPETRMLPAGTIRYLRMGASGPAVVLVHGFGGDLNTWLFNQPELARAYRTLSLDLPGHGGSGKDVTSGTLDELAEAVLALVQTLDFMPAHIVGHSLGGAVAARAIELNPERFLSLTMINSAGPGTVVDHAYIEGFVAARRRKDMREVVQKLFADKSLVTNQLVDALLRIKRMDGANTCLQRVAEAALLSIQDEPAAADVSGLPVPVQIIWGARDEVAGPEQCAGMNDALAVKVIEDAGHMTHMEAAAMVNRLLLAHFAGVDSVAASEQVIDMKRSDNE